MHESVHFIGIGGIGMSALAFLLVGQGTRVSGSDQKPSAMLERLRQAGADVHVGHQAANLQGAPLVVISTAVQDNNPELVEAKARGLTIWHRADLLGYFLKTRRSVAITGTHGKTTTSAMAALIFQQAGISPSAAIGGEVPQFGGNFLVGSGNDFVAEVDESDKTIRRLTAQLAVVTNLEADHLDHYQGYADILATVGDFLRDLPPGAPIVLCADDAGTRELATTLERPYLTYGVHSDADYRIVSVVQTQDGSTFQVTAPGGDLGVFTLPLPGLHNVLNATAAIAAAHLRAVPMEAARDALQQYKSVGRRYQLIGEPGGMQIIDDYAHHPTEIKALLSMARLQNRPITVVFQPHRYSRTHALLQQFAEALSEADMVYLTDIYGAGEDPSRHPVTSQDLLSAIRALGTPAALLPTLTDAENAISHVPGGLLLTVGAGDITTLGPRLVSRFQAALLP